MSDRRKETASFVDGLKSFLNSEQFEAVTAPIDGKPLVIIAGCGSGKTTVLTYRIVFLILQGVDPSKIVAITFTRKAAQEIRERVIQYWEKISSTPIVGMFVGTFHSYCLSILRKSKTLVNPLTGESKTVRGKLRVVSREKAEALFKKIVKKYKKGGGIRVSDACTRVLDGISKRKATFSDFAFEDPLERELAEKYIEHAYENNIIDHQDMIYQLVLLMDKSERVRMEVSESVEYVLVDEFQDSNYLQLKLLTLLDRGRGNITVVGDDDQCLVPGTEIRLDGNRSASIESVRPERDSALVGLGKKTGRVLRLKSSRALLDSLVRVEFEGIDASLVLTPNHKVFARCCPKETVYLHRTLHTLSVGCDTHGVPLGNSRDASEIRRWVEHYRREYSENGVQEYFLDWIMDRLGLHYNINTGGYLTEALNLFPGMMMMCISGKEVAVKSVSVVPRYTGLVHDLEVEGYHRYFANGILVHNSIYGFRGSDPEIFQKLFDSYSSHRRVTLTRNYRSTKKILRNMNFVIRENRMRIKKTLVQGLSPPVEGAFVEVFQAVDQESEMRYVFSRISEITRDSAVVSVAVLLRTNSLVESFSNYGSRKCGLDLHVVADSDAEEEAPSDDHEAFWTSMADMDEEIYNTIDRNDMEAVVMAGITVHICKRLRRDVPKAFCEKEFQRVFSSYGGDDKEILTRILEAVKSGGATLQAVRMRVEQRGRASTDGDPTGARIRVMTVHQSKGLEFDAVFVPGMRSRSFPKISVRNIRSQEELDRALEEERRLFYVAISRARRRLFISFHGESPSSASVFIKNLDPSQCAVRIEKEEIESGIRRSGGCGSERRGAAASRAASKPEESVGASGGGAVSFQTARKLKKSVGASSDAPLPFRTARKLRKANGRATGATVSKSSGTRKKKGAQFPLSKIVRIRGPRHKRLKTTTEKARRPLD